MEKNPVLLTVLDMARNLGISSVAVNKRLQRFGRKAARYIGSAGLYTEADQEAIRGGGVRGRPKKTEPATQAATKPKAPKSAKKK